MQSRRCRAACSTRGREIGQITIGTALGLLGIATMMALAVNATGMPNAFMFGPLAIVIGLTASDVHFSSVPTGLSNCAQALLGCALGSRFERRSLKSAPRYVVAVLTSVAAGIAFAAAFAVLLARASGLPLATLVLATAPGGLAEGASRPKFFSSESRW